MINSSFRYQSGYAVLPTLLVIFVVVLLLTITASLLSIDELQITQSLRDSSEVRFLAESCVAETLLELNEMNAISPQIVLPQGTCSVTINQQVNNSWTYQVQAQIGSDAKTVEVTAERDATVSVTHWKEL